MEQIHDLISTSVSLTRTLSPLDRFILALEFFVLYNYELHFICVANNKDGIFFFFLVSRSSVG